MRNDWFINDGLKAGDRVVVDGALALSPGAQVQVVRDKRKRESPEAGAP